MLLLLYYCSYRLSLLVFFEHAWIMLSSLFDDDKILNDFLKRRNKKRIKRESGNGIEKRCRRGASSSSLFFLVLRCYA